MASTAAMSSATLFYGGTIYAGSVFAMYEMQILAERGIEIIKCIIECF